MPRFNFTDGEVNELTDYIMTVYQNPAVDRESMPLSGYSQGEIELGKQLFYGKYACQGCHIVDTKTDKGYIGPTSDACWFAPDRSLDLSMDEESASAASGHGRTESRHE